MPVGVFLGDWRAARLGGELVRILVDEVLGYNAVISGRNPDSSVCIHRLGGCVGAGRGASAQCSPDNSTDHIAVEMWESTYYVDIGGLQSLLGDKAPVNHGSVGYDGYENMHMARDLLERSFASNGLPLEHYKSHNGSFHDNSQWFMNYTSFNVSELKACQNTRIVQDGRMRNYLLHTGDADGVETIGGQMRAKCEGGPWFLSPACRAERHKCIPLITGGDGWAIDEFMMKAASYNMPLAIATGSGWSQFVRYASQGQTLFYWWFPDDTFATMDPMPIVFPAHNAGEWEVNNKRTAQKETKLTKFASYLLASAAPRVNEMLANLDLTPQHIKAILLDGKVNGGTEEEVACRWLLANEAAWRRWIPVQTKCLSGWGLVSHTGAYVAERANASACSYCPPGRMSVELEDAEGKTHRCEECRPGTHQPSPLMTQCLDCEAGKFAGVAGLSGCQECPAGTSVNSTAATVCVDCTPGSYQAALGSTSCERCESGRFNAASRATACTDCNPGSFSSRGSAACQNCSMGEYAPAAGSQRCSSCPPGTAGGSTGMRECDRCSRGRYADAPGFSACMRCGAGLASEDSWTTLQRIEVQGEQEWVPVDGSSDAADCGCGRGLRLEAGECVPCEGEGLECPGKGEVHILKGYASGTEISVYHCFGNLLRCPGGLPGDTCAAGRVGSTCAECGPFMTPGPAGTCVECGGSDTAPFVAAIIIALLVLFVMYFSMDRYKRATQTHAVVAAGICFGHFIGFAQQMAVVGMMVELDEPLASCLKFFQIFAFDIQILRLDCVGSVGALGRYAGKICGIFIALCLVVLIHCAFVFLKHNRRFRDRMPSLLNALGTIAMVSFTTVVVAVLAPMQCSKHPNGQWTMLSYQAVACWDGSSGDHAVMLGIGIVALLLPLCFVAKCLAVIVSLPGRMRVSDTSFLNCYGFIFFRVRPQAAWYVLFVLLRSLTVSVAPIFPDPVAQIFILQVVFVLALVLTAHFLPWRVPLANAVDCCFTCVAIAVTFTAALRMKDQNLGAISWLCVIAIIGIASAVLIVALRAIYLRCGPQQKPFQFFLTHHKAKGGAFARLLKLQLQASRHVSRQVFLDSDNLENLDMLLDHVGSSVETLVIIATEGVYLRPWCAAEMTIARLKGVRTVLVSMPDYVPPEEDVIERYQELSPDLACLAENGINVPMVQETLRWLRSLPTIHMPPTVSSSVVQGLVDALVSKDPANQVVKAAVEAAPVESDVLLVADDANPEACATALVLSRSLAPYATQEGRTVPQLLSAGQSVTEGTHTVLLVCTSGCFMQRSFMDALAEAGELEVRVLPIIADGNFHVPKPEQLLSVGSPRSCMLVQEMLKEIAATFLAQHASDSALELSAKIIADRLSSGSVRRLKTPRVTEEGEGDGKGGPSSAWANGFMEGKRFLPGPWGVQILVGEMV